MHELSIIQSVVEVALESASQQSPCVIRRVHLRVGALSGVVKDSLLFCYDIATEGTPLVGSQLIITEVPVTIYCQTCIRNHVLPGVGSFRCPECGGIAVEVVGGRELEVESLEVEVPDPPR